MIGLSGNSALNRREALEAAFKTLSLVERRLIQESEHKSAFQEKYEKVQKTDYLKENLTPELLEKIKGVIPRIEKEKLYRGLGGEIMRTGVCHYIYSMALAKIPFDVPEQLGLLQALIENLKHPSVEIQAEATKALRALNASYWDSQVDPVIVNEIRKMLKPSQSDENVSLTRGFNMAFGALSKAVISILGEDLLQVLIKNCLIKGIELEDAETRKAAVESLGSAVRTLGIRSLGPEMAG